MRRLLLICCVALAACGSSDGESAQLEGQRLCGSTKILGELIPKISSSVPGCGLTDGVRVFSVAGVRLSRPATVDCTTARALNDWVTEEVRPTVGKRGGGVDELQVFASYACRPRNNIIGAKVSEHGRGRAVDIGGFTLKDGSQISVLSGWSQKAEGSILRKLHDGACGLFGTVLGPKSDRFHANHFHLDTARYRKGPFCR